MRARKQHLLMLCVCSFIVVAFNAVLMQHLCALQELSLSDRLAEMYGCNQKQAAVVMNMLLDKFFQGQGSPDKMQLLEDPQPNFIILCVLRMS